MGREASGRSSGYANTSGVGGGRYAELAPWKSYPARWEGNKEIGSQENKVFQQGSGGRMVITCIYKDPHVNVIVCEEENLRARPCRSVVPNSGHTLELRLAGAPCTKST